MVQYDPGQDLSTSKKYVKREPVKKTLCEDGRHPSFAIVRLEKNLFQLFCYECRQPMGFSFFSKKEWDELGKGRKVCHD